jgi:hypothetical protein
MNIKILALFIFTLLFISGANAEGNASITVHFSNKELCKNPMTLFIIKDYIDGNVGAAEQNVRADANGDYKFFIAGIDKYSMFRLDVVWNCGIVNLIEEGDQIRIDYNGDKAVDINSNSLTYRGKGSERLVAAAKTAAIPVNGFEQIRASKKFDQLVLDSLTTSTVDFYHSQMAFFKPVRHKMSKAVYQIMQANNFGSAGLTAMSFIGAHRKKLITEQDLTDLLTQLDKCQPKVHDKILAQSDVYIRYRYRRATKIVELKNVEKQDRPLLICDVLISQDKDNVLEKSLMCFLCQSEAVTNSRNPDAVYAKALKYIHTPSRRAYLIKLAESRKKGAQAYNFSLPDTSGKYVRLSDFKNKVVMIDCWFTGCSSCTGTAKSVEQGVVPSFKDNPDVVFISICVDKSRTMWLNSVRSGLYTHPGSIDLYTEGLGDSHPFMKHYNFQGFPRLMLIGKDGKIFSSNMPRGAADMVGLIKQALKFY